MAGQTERIAVVLGVDNVVGRACAITFATEADRVIVVDPSPVAAEGVAAAVDRAHGRGWPFSADLGDLAALQHVAELIAAEHASVQVLVNAHYGIDWGSFRDSAVEDWEAVLRTNVLGPVVAAKAFLPLLEAAGAGSIVNMGSVDGFQGNPMVPSYSVTKGAIPAMTHVMADEFASLGIRVNCVARAAVEDPDVVAASSTLHGDAMACTPLARPATGEEVARVVAFLAGSDASYVTGSTVVVDGGRTGLTPGTAVRRRTSVR